MKKLADEAAAIDALLAEPALDDPLAEPALDTPSRARVRQRAERLVAAARARRHEQSPYDAFLHGFGLSSSEGIALMCLAEALLRIPDAATADALIAEKIGAASWTGPGIVRGALSVTNRIIRSSEGPWLGRVTARLGEPVIRTAIQQAMRLLGTHFIAGRTIEEALRRQGGALFSFDMLGEGARTAADAARYLENYFAAIAQVGAAANGSGVSVKLSALHPRYDYAHRHQVLPVLGERLLGLARHAREARVALTIDAEEADRLDLSLILFEGLARAPDLSGWDGLGLAVQAYQKRALAVIDRLIALARETKRRFAIRLVKGAYWDSEIKAAQEKGLPDYPVFTRKEATDLSYIVAARRLLAARDAVFPQFATHNAATIAALLELAGPPEGTDSEGTDPEGIDPEGIDYEFQRLHGMGELLYDVVAKDLGAPVRCRIYAPVGSHRDLLPYLVRRLLENGANSSFVNRFLDPAVPVAAVAADPVALLAAAPVKRHPRIPPPPLLYGPERPNAAGLDLADPAVAAAIEQECQASLSSEGEPKAADLQTALAAAASAQPAWDRAGGGPRAACLRRMADLLEENRSPLIRLIVREAGRTIPDALSELREAVDFCRYYALDAEARFAAPLILPGPTGESNALSLHGRGVFACISPWNFPLSIFCGQVAAALAAGNAVIAKPAPQTPRVAAAAVRLFHQAGIPADLLHLAPGGTAVGQALVSDPRVAGVAFTGSVAGARAINRTLAARDGPIIPLIAETGGQNAMIVDSTALIEQAVDDILRSAFGSAGQRCSALRVLYVQEEIAEPLIAMLAGAMDELVIGDPGRLETDVGPIIDEAARQRLESYARIQRGLIKRCRAPDRGNYFPPTLFEIERIGEIPGEIFGPILHVIRFPIARLDAVLAEIRASGYGLTLGLQSRLAGLADHVLSHSRVGNVYVNRSMIGAVVGVQPFGGEGLSGTGPKAGGPHYLLRFATERVISVNTAAIGGNAALVAEA